MLGASLLIRASKQHSKPSPSKTSPADVLLASWDRAGRHIWHGSLTRRSLASPSQGKEVEENLREPEGRYRELFENAPYGIYCSTSDGKFLNVNQALVAILGYESRSEVLALDFATDIYCDRSVRDRLVKESLSNERLVAPAVEWKRKDGTRIVVRLSGRSLYNRDLRLSYFEVFVEDITERRRLEKQVATLQKFDAIGRLAGGIAHDFNNVVCAIQGWAEIGAADLVENSPQRKYFENIRSQASRAAGLTGQLLAFARRQLIEPQDLDLNVVISETLGLLERAIGAHIQVKTVFRSQIGVARADPSQIEQVLMNLCLNARDAMPNGGELVVETQSIYIDEEYSQIHPYAKPGEYVLLTVSDTGVGMDAMTLEHVFEPFFTTKPTGQGTGLGLATVYGIVKQHGGFVNVYSELGTGTTFRVYLPAVPGQATTKDKHADETLRGGSETILVAEDHEALAEIVLTVLQRLGYTILLARDGEQAVELFRQHHKRISLVLLDLVMPKRSGPEAYEHICKIGKRVPAIFVTGYSTEVDHLRSLIAKDTPILQKPYSPSALARAVREILDRVAESETVRV